ncbi:helix-turn-helix domain-containing protein [soil metagenome]
MKKSDNRIRHEKFLPNTRLPGLVKYLYVLEHNGNIDDATYQRITPDGCIEVNFNLVEKSLIRTGLNGIEYEQPNFYTVGRLSNYYFLKRTRNVKIFGVCFYPWGFHSFTKLPLNEINGSTLQNEHVFGRDIISIQNQLYEKTDTQAFEIIQNYLIDKLKEINNRDPLIKDAISMIYNSQGNMKLPDLLNQYGLSQRRIEQRFNANVGITPKQFLKLVKFKNVFSNLNNISQSTRITNLVYDHGYYDQSHLIRDFSSFTGLPPKRYLKEKHPLNELIHHWYE